MDKYSYEIVEYKNQTPAMFAVLDESEINKYFQTDIFIPSHWHRSLEISLIENAEVILQIGEKEYLIEDDFTCVNCGIVHSLKVKSLKKNPNCIILLISYDFIKSYCPEIDNVCFDLSKNKNHDTLKVLYYKLRDLHLNKTSYSYLDITACILEILSHLLREYQVPRNSIENKSYRNQEKFKEVLNYLHEHYTEELTLNYMSELFYVSKEYFSRQFHHYVGKTFRDYLVSFRLYKSYKDVVKSNMTIQDIARKHGFSNVRSFIKAFTEEYNETPLRYRKKSQEFDIK